MEQWEQIIVEWINCLDVLKEPLKNTKDLQDGTFYVDFLNLILWTKYDRNRADIIIQFIEDEYPSFKVNKSDSTEHIYIASLLLVHISQLIIFHTPMCNKLKHETQIRIKAFLENILPLGRNVTKETMKEVIVELENASRTPNGHQTPLKDFATSSILRSTRSRYKIMMESTRELREIKCNLDTERFKNADLQDDLKLQQKKIQNLQNKLEEKNELIKALREERIKPCTPQPKKKDSALCEGHYKKYINDLEVQLSKQQDEIDDLETEKDSLSKTLTSVQRQSVQCKESLVNTERSLESLLSKIEIKDRELIELRMHNEELRAHIKGLNQNSVSDKSFEVEETTSLLCPAMTSLNNSEALSSVIEIQLQEAKEESAVLRAQIDSWREKFDLLTKDYKSTLELNRDLQEKVKIFDRVQAELNDMQRELNASNVNIASLQVERTSLVAQNENLKSLLSTREKKLSETEQSNDVLSIKLDSLKSDVESLNQLLGNEKTNSSDLSIILVEIKSQITENLARNRKLTDERDSYRHSVENCSKNLRDILHCGNQFIQIETDDLNNLTLCDLINYFDTMLRNCNMTCASYKCDIEKLTAKIDEINENLSKQQLTIATLREQNQQNLVELANIEEEEKRKNLLLNEQKETICKHLQEIEALKEIRKEKDILEESVSKLTKDLTNRNLLLKSATMYLEKLQNVAKNLKLIKHEAQQKFIKFEENLKATVEKIHNYLTLYYNEKEELICHLNHTKEELATARITNTALEQNLSQYNDTINILEEKERSLCNELNECKQNTQELVEVNQALKEQYTEMKIKADNQVENVKLDNTKISLELKNAIEKLDLLKQEMNEKVTEIELKNEQINELLLHVSSLKAEKDHLIRSYDERITTKDNEIEWKHKALLMSQTKMEKLLNETSTDEKKMKEIIINLQEVRSSQAAVLATQETALKEKCLRIEQLQEQFDKCKKVLSKELEFEKSSHRELQTKFLELQERIHNQNRDAEELRKKLKMIHAELETSKDRCKFMDVSQAEIVKLCHELEHPTKNLNSTITETCSDFDIFDQNLRNTSQYKYTYTDSKTENILNIIKMTLDELHMSQKAISHLSFINSELNKTLAEQKILIENNRKDREEACTLKNKVQELEIITQKRNEYLNGLIKNKESLKDSLQRIFASRHDLDNVLTSSKQKWNQVLTKFQDILHTDNPVCEEFKQLQAKKLNFENTLSKYRMNYLETIKSISDILWEKFLWTEQKLYDTHLCSVHEKESLDFLTTTEEDQFSNEKIIIDMELEKTKSQQIDVIKSEEELQSFIALATSYEDALKSGKIRTQSETEKNLYNQISQLTKEKKDLKNKVDTMRSRNVKLEKNMDDLRIEIKKLKSETASNANDLGEVQILNKELEFLKEQNQQLRNEKDESNKIAKQEFESQLKEVHTTYERKLEHMKQKMKKAYNEEIAKLNSDQERIVQEKLHGQMESMCQKQREEINRYKAHVGDLSSQLWSVGEKLLIEQQQKQEALKHSNELQIKLKEIEQEMSTAQLSSHKSSRVEEQEISPESGQQTMRKVTVIKEEIFERRHSVRSIQTMGNAFKAEDEEEVFDNVCLADIQKSNYLPVTDINRLSILQMRNAQCKPHLKSSYPAEMQFLPSNLTEEDIKTGSITEDIFNDSLSQSLLPEQKAKKRDRYQTSYKKPGPPTPSKNGGRLSLQGNELRSPSLRVLKERNVDRRTTTTPRALKQLFTMKRQDENATSTPKGRRLSNLFRKPR